MPATCSVGNREAAADLSLCVMINLCAKSRKEKRYVAVDTGIVVQDTPRGRGHLVGHQRMTMLGQVAPRQILVSHGLTY